MLEGLYSEVREGVLRSMAVPGTWEYTPMLNINLTRFYFIWEEGIFFLRRGGGIFLGRGFNLLWGPFLGDRGGYSFFRGERWGFYRGVPGGGFSPQHL